MRARMRITLLCILPSHIHTFSHTAHHHAGRPLIIRTLRRLETCTLGQCQCRSSSCCCLLHFAIRKGRIANQGDCSEGNSFFIDWYVKVCCLQDADYYMVMPSLFLLSSPLIILLNSDLTLFPCKLKRFDTLK